MKFLVLSVKGKTRGYSERMSEIRHGGALEWTGHGAGIWNWVHREDDTFFKIYRLVQYNLKKKKNVKHVRLGLEFFFSYKEKKFIVIFSTLIIFFI